MIKRFAVLLSILFILTGCNVPTQEEVIDSIPEEETTAEGETSSGSNEVTEGKCPDPAIPATLTFGHHVAQNYMGNVMSSDASGSVPLIIGTKGVNGNGTINMQLSGSFPRGGCTMSGSNTANVDVNGVCKNGQLELMLTETYSGGSVTTTCRGQGSTSAVPGTTTTHEITMPMEHGYTVSAPFVGEAGSGTYNWSLSLMMDGDDDFSGDDIENVPLGEPSDDIENVPLVPTPTS